jgi:hypothetical protein
VPPKVDNDGVEIRTTIDKACGCQALVQSVLSFPVGRSQGSAMAGHEQSMFVLSGTATLYLDGLGHHELTPDTAAYIASGESYSVEFDPMYAAFCEAVVTYDADGNLKTIDWRAVVLGLQYYLPVVGGRVWVSVTASRLESANILSLTPEASRGGIFTRQDYVDGNVFAALTPNVQLGLSYQQTKQTFGDLPFAVNVHPTGRNQRGEIGFRFFF